MLPLDKWGWCKTGTLNVEPWAIKVIVNRLFFNKLYHEVKKNPVTAIMNINNHSNIFFNIKIFISYILKYKWTYMHLYDWYWKSEFQSTHVLCMIDP